MSTFALARALWRRAFALCLALLAACAAPPAALRDESRPAPEAASGHSDKPGWSARRFMVAAANPLAAEAGYRILKAGGSAVDAAIAVQMVLALVEPQASGIGGGAFLMHWDGRNVQVWDGRETAPAAVDDRLFLRPDGKPMPFREALIGGRAVGVPGAVRMLEAVHAAHGRLPWAALFEPAITLAEQGFRISPRLYTLALRDTALQRDAQARAYFFGVDGQPLPVGHLLRNPALADVLRAIAARGSAALHGGAIAADIVARVRGHGTNPGLLSAADMAAYAPRQREPICTDWLAVYRVCGVPPPSSGHLAIMQILGLLQRMPKFDGPLVDGTPAASWLHYYTEAARLAAADRALYVADPDFVAPPAGRWTRLLDPVYLQQRAALIGPEPMKLAPAGMPDGVTSAFTAQPEQPEFGTSHLSVIDAEGHAIAMTTTIEYAFGAHLMSDGGTGKPGGFLLNNELTDFSFAPTDDQGKPIANRVQPGKRPRSSMSPTLVFDRRDGRLLMSLGSSGGAEIIDSTAKTLIGTLDWGLDAQRAIALPNFGSYNGQVVLERGRFPAATIVALKARGHTIMDVDMPSGLHAIQRTPSGWFGGADPRREGVAMGD
jgi:gamma-glutamyltranspeptidase / glutathione hydrolase